MAYKKYKIGDILKAEITGIQPYGIFAALDDEIQGLIHISEVKHGYVEKLNELFEVGEEIEVMILDIDEFNGRISLSLRTLQNNTQHPVSNRSKIPRYGKQTGSDFDSLEKMLPKWIDQALDRIESKYEE